MVFFWKIKSGEKFFVYFIHMCINNSELSFSKLKCIGGTLRFFGVCLKQFFFLLPSRKGVCSHLRPFLMVNWKKMGKTNLCKFSEDIIWNTIITNNIFQLELNNKTADSIETLYYYNYVN